MDHNLQIKQNSSILDLSGYCHYQPHNFASTKVKHVNVCEHLNDSTEHRVIIGAIVSCIL